MHRIICRDETSFRAYEGKTELEAVSAAFAVEKCDSGPMSGRAPRDFCEFQDRCIDAYGGEVDVYQEIL